MPVRFAIKTRPEHQTWAQIRDVWVAADEVDLFESAWNWDHFYPLTEPYDGPNLEAWTMIAALAQATRRIRLGCQVTGMVYRHPAVLANMVATTDIISGGRLELGVGAGWNQMECDAYGIELPPDPQDWLSLKETLVEHCASVGRDPGEITCSVNVRVEGPDAIKRAAEQAAAYRDAGADLAIMNLPVPAEPAMLEPLAEALAPLA